MSSQQVTRFMQNSDEDSHIVLDNIKKAIDGIEYYDVSELETSLKDVMPSALTVIQKIYTKNALIVQANHGDVLDIIRSNLQVAISLMDTSNSILQYVTKNGSIAFSLIPSVPVNMADVLFFTFDHCKSSQKIYSCYYKSIDEILELFRKAREVYTKYLSFLDTYLTIDFFNGTHVIAYKRIVDTILKISRTLSSVNIKSMADSWKGFISLIQKAPTDGTVNWNLSSAIQILTEEINNNLLLTETEDLLSDSIKFNQHFKITGFLVKVVLKLFETGLNLVDSYEDILKFWVIIYSWNDGFFRTNIFPDPIIDCVSALFHFSLESTASLLKDSSFLKFCIIHGKFSTTSKQNFGFLLLINTLIKGLPQLLQNEPELKYDFKIIFLIRLIFDLTRGCYVEYCYDYNSGFYNEFVTNVAVIILLFPNQFSEIENMLTEYILGESIWTSVIVTDIWCLVLKYSRENVCQLTLNTLIKKIEELSLGVFHETSATIRLKIFAQRILKSLLNDGRHDEIAKYNPTQLFVWKILKCRNIPLSYRYYVEFVMGDIFEKMDIIEKEDYTYSDILHLMEILGIISYTKFNELEINTTRLLPIVQHLWSFDMHDMSSTNSFFKYFLYNLIRITIAVSGELTGDNFLLILTQLKVLLNDSESKVLITEVLHEVAKRNFSHFPEKHTLFSLIVDIFKILINDKNGIVVQQTLEIFINMFNNNSNYEIVINKVNNNSLESKHNIVYYSQKCAAKARYNLKYFESIQRFNDQHQCYDLFNSSQPACKKIKIDDTAVVINTLKDNAEKLLNVVNKCEFNTKQRNEIKSVIDKLETLLS